MTADDAIQWNNTYGIWADDLLGSPIADAVARRWTDTQIVLSDGARELGRGYVLLDNAAAIARFGELLTAGGVQRIHQAVQSLDHDDLGTTLTLADGRTVRATLVVDATGVGRFTVRDGPGTDLHQIAVGRVLTGDHPYAGHAMRLMDFTSDGLYADSEPPSFLYAMPLENGVFVEETFLVAPGNRSTDVLAQRLDARLARDGVAARATGRVEHVRIPMGMALPAADQRVVPFGAAAGFIHPATGYSVGRSLSESGPLADVLAGSLGRGESPDRASRKALAHMWSDDARLAYELLQFGGRFLASLDTAQTRMFFEAFFSTPRQTWVDYLRGDLPAGDLAAVMLRIFRASPGSLRLRMMWSGARPATVVSALRSLTRTRRSA